MFCADDKYSSKIINILDIVPSLCAVLSMSDSQAIPCHQVGYMEWLGFISRMFWSQLKR